MKMVYVLEICCSIEKHVKQNLRAIRDVMYIACATIKDEIQSKNLHRTYKSKMGVLGS